MVGIMSDARDLTKELHNMEPLEDESLSNYEKIRNQVSIYSTVIHKDATPTWRALKRLDERDIKNFSVSFFNHMSDNLQLLLENLFDLNMISDSETHLSRYTYGVEIGRFLKRTVSDLQIEIEKENIYDSRQIVPVLTPFFNGINDLTEGEMIGTMMSTGKMSLQDFDNVQKKVDETMKLFMEGEDVSSRDFGTNHFTYYILNSKFPIDLPSEGTRLKYEGRELPQEIIDSILMAHYDGWLRLQGKSGLYDDAIKYTLKVKGKDERSELLDLRDASYPLILSYVAKNLENYENSKKNPLVV